MLLLLIWFYSFTLFCYLICGKTEIWEDKYNAVQEDALNPSDFIDLRRYTYFRVLFKVRQGAILKTIRYSRATYGLLAHTGNHLRDVNEGSCMQTVVDIGVTVRERESKTKTLNKQKFDNNTRTKSLLI